MNRVLYYIASMLMTILLPFTMASAVTTSGAFGSKNKAFTPTDTQKEIADKTFNALVSSMEESNLKSKVHEEIVNNYGVTRALLRDDNNEIVCQVPANELSNATPDFMQLSSAANEAAFESKDVRHCNEQELGEITEAVQFASLGSYGGSKEAALGPFLFVGLYCAVGAAYAGLLDLETIEDHSIVLLEEDLGKTFKVVIPSIAVITLINPSHGIGAFFALLCGRITYDIRKCGDAIYACTSPRYKENRYKRNQWDMQ